MKKIIISSLIVLFFTHHANSQYSQPHNIPFSTNDSSLTIWNGTEYIPFFMKGVNLGVAIPGTFPGEMAATKDDYVKWFIDIKEAGFNTIRLYTLHFPRFYEALDSFNLANLQNPLLFIQGVWLEEELAGYDHNLHYLTGPFRGEIEENIDCVHGNRIIPPRLGKAYGEYTTDASNWCLAYIIGREVYPIEVLVTDFLNAGINSYNGEHLSISNASPSEVWFTEMLDYTIQYQNQNYGTQRPVSNSSWPTLDPIIHPEEWNPEEDTASIDLSKVQIHNAPAGMFISYHAYPYYPDFISLQSSYQSYSDDYGPNSYRGYLTELKSHYQNMPLIIAEFGVPSSWAIAHYATSGMNHGGFDEYNQGVTNLRMLETIRQTGCGGGILFAWIDEWFKRTWITDPVDYIADSRILWHNISAAEQNYGLISYGKQIYSDTLIPLDPSNNISYLKSRVNYSFFELEIGLKNHLDIPDELWVTFDTYSDQLGESILPSGHTIPSRAEFALHITNYSAQFFVTEAYDIFGIWHNYTEPNQLYQSVPTDGSPWKILRVRNNHSHSDVQYIGNMQLNYEFQPPSSKDAVTIYDNKINVRIPWFYLSMVAPDQMKVLHDDQSTPEREDTISDGFHISVLYKDQWFTPDSRLTWEPWVYISDTSVSQHYKQSYYVMKNNLHNFNSVAIAVRDSFIVSGPNFPAYVESSQGLLMNDFDIDGNLMISLLTEPPKHGQVIVYNDGSFMYQPNEGFNGFDSLKYCIFDGYSLSQPNTAVIEVKDNYAGIPETLAKTDNLLNIFPNPASTVVTIETQAVYDGLMLFNAAGQWVHTEQGGKTNYEIDISGLESGIYLLVARGKGNFVSAKIVRE